MAERQNLRIEAEIDLSKGLDYEFTGMGSTASDSVRFELVFVESGRSTNGQTVDPDVISGEPGVKLSPNPSQSADVKLSLRSKNPGKYSVQVIDMAGRLVATISLEHRSMNADYPILEGRWMTPGTYIIRLSDQDKQLKETLRLVVE